MNDDIIKQIAEEYITALCASLPATEAYSYTFSPQFEKKMKRLIFKTNHPYRFVLSRAASVAIVFLLFFSSVLAVDVKAREAFIGWLEECHITFSRFFFAGEVEAQEELHFDLGWVPEGYVAQERIKIPGANLCSIQILTDSSLILPILPHRKTQNYTFSLRVPSSKLPPSIPLPPNFLLRKALMKRVVSYGRTVCKVRSMPSPVDAAVLN